ncbi:MAG: NAD(P)/FAD-dependent oxidoreductase [Syntrophales bacterium]
MYIVIGQGIAGSTAATMLRKQDPHTPVAVITNELHYVYSRIDLPDIIAGKCEPAASVLRTAEDFAKAGIECLMGETAVALLRDEKAVLLSSGRRFQYDKLLLATGSLPVVPPVPGGDAPGVYSLWTLQQAGEILDAAGKARSAVVMGAGLIGLKTALALKKRGLNVTVIEKLPRLLPRQLDDEASDMLAESVREEGVEILVGMGIDAISVDSGAVGAVNAGGRVFPADLVVMAIGVKPNIGLAVAVGIETGRGITVDEFQRTSDPDVYAAGDAAETLDPLTGDRTIPASWPVAVAQGRIAASSMAGGRATYDGMVAMNAVEIGGMPLVSIGDIEGQTGDEVLAERRNGAYRKVVIRDGKIRGVLFLGEIRQAGVIGSLISRRVEIAEVERLTSPHFSYADLIAV